MSESATSLTIDVKPGERLVLSPGISVELIQKSGQRARLRVRAPADVQIKKQSESAERFVTSMAR